MTMSRRLQITLYVIAAYLASFGVLFVFAPSVFERVTQTPLPDALIVNSVLTVLLVLFRTQGPLHEARARVPENAQTDRDR